MNRRRLPFLLLSLLAAFAGAAAPARAGDVSQLAIDHVYVSGREHVIVVRAADDAGVPVDGIARSFEVSVDGRGVGDLRATSPFGGGPRTVTVVVDGTLLAPSSAGRPFVEGALQALAGQLAPTDRVQVVSAGPKVTTGTWSAAALKASPGEPRGLAQDGGAKLFDALRLAADAAAKARSAGSGLVLVITNGADAGSRARMADVLARCTVGEGVTSVAVAVLEDGSGAPAADKLDRLAGVTHGFLRRSSAAGGAAQDFVSTSLAVARRWELRFRPLEWDASEDRHSLDVRIARTHASATQAYRLSEVSNPPWWRSLWVWVIVAFALAAAAVVLLASRKRPVGLLVIASGEDEGVWFEILDLPLTLGSALQNDVLLVGEGVSRNHCVLEREGRDVVLKDTNSEQGVYVNDERVHRHVLADEDRVRLGDQLELVFESRR